jgi:ketosteroid isomerase-like protein
MSATTATSQKAIAAVLEAFAAVEARDDERLARISHPDLTFHWPHSLRASSFLRADASAAHSWEEVWDRFQPSADERRMSPRVVAASDREVAVIWHQRGVNAAGERLDCEVFGLYEVRDGRLARAQMFYFDSVIVQRFLKSTPPP